MTASPPSVEGRLLFTFAVVSDTHVNESEDRSPSPFRTNLLANGRARFVVHEIAAMDPPVAFIVHLGDMVHPVPSQSTYQEAVARYREITQVIKVPVHQIPGNHDIGDKALDWMPADIITDDFLAAYRLAFGADRFAFEHGPIHCIGINSVLINSGLAEEGVQRDWLEAKLAKHRGQRLFLFSHYPPFVFSPEEASGYDNIDEPGRTWLLDLVRRHRVEALFSGHVHNFWYDRTGDTELYIQPSTTFIRHDYSELARVTPEDEFGRNDPAKFGYALVDVHERGHVMRLIRTNDATLAPDARFVPRRLVPAPSPRTVAIDNIGVELRHPWAEVVEIPATGGVQEFGRKLARNDYQLQALWEMGARLLKVPQQDVITPATRERMKLLHSIGHRIITTSLGLPARGFADALATVPDVVDAIEVNLSSEQLARDADQLRALKVATGRPVYWSKLRMREDARYDGGKFSHFVKSGLVPAELADEPRWIADRRTREAIDGVVVRLERGTDLLTTVPTLADFATRSGLRVIGTIVLADAGIAIRRGDDFDTARIVAEGMISARACENVTLTFDTFMDVDRGYHPRHGFIDRRFCPRPALHVYAALTSLLAAAGPLTIEGIEASGSGRLVCFTTPGTRHILVSGLDDAAASRLIAAQGGPPRVVDLCRGAFAPRQFGGGDPAHAPQAAHAGLWLLSGRDKNAS
jgi:predicted phosphodiesterase